MLWLPRKDRTEMRIISTYRTAFALVDPLALYGLIPENIHFELFLNNANSLIKNSKS